MKFITLLLLVPFLFLPAEIKAQDSTRNSAIDWEAVDIALIPLEEIVLEPPQLSTGSNGERQTWLYLGQPAPWDGVLLNPPAAAFIISEYEAAFERAAAAIDRQRSSDRSRLNLEIGRLKLHLSTVQQQYQIELEGRDQEIIRVRTAHQALLDEVNGNWWGDFLLVALPTLAGVGIGIIIGFLVGAAN